MITFPTGRIGAGSTKSVFEIIKELQEKRPDADQRRLAKLLAERLREDDDALVEAAKYVLSGGRS
jgi:hypothetical protein